MTEKEKVVCYYHNDMDGMASAAIVKIQYPDAELIGCDYGNDNPIFKPAYDKCFVVDFSFDKGVMELLKKRSKMFCWIDHHKSAMEKLPDLWKSNHTHGLRRLDLSGCELTWEWFNIGVEAPMIIKYIGDYDMWEFKYGERTKRVCEYLNIDATGPEYLINAIKNRDNCLSETEQGELLLQAKDNRVIKAFAEGNDILFHGVRTRVCNSNNDVSNIGNYCCKQGYSIGLIWSIRNNKVIIGLRSIGDMDVSLIAKQHGGGGHKNAAGFETYISFIEGITK